MHFRFAPMGRAPEYDPQLAVGCDGLPPARVSLSHWPGNATPADLKRDLSTGIALAFAALGAERRRERFGRLEFAVNDHFDTDGLLAIFTCMRPDEALRREDALLAAARAGDFWCAPSRRACAFDLAVSSYDDDERSPLGPPRAGESRADRVRAAFDDLLRRMPGALDDPFSIGAPIDEELARVEEDLMELRSSAAVTREPNLDFCIMRPRRAVDARAVHEAAQADRMLTVRESDGGVLATLRVSPHSWFETTRGRRLARPDFERIADRLRQAEHAVGNWIISEAEGPSPLLYFGDASEDGSVRNGAPSERPSSQTPDAIISIITRTLREGAA